MKSYFIVCLLLSIFTYVLANTEIVNFEATPTLDAKVNGAKQWPVLNPGNNEIRLEIRTIRREFFGECSETRICSQEAIIKLELDGEEWKGFSRFTLRLSWPAFFPSDIYMQTLDPEDLSTANYTSSSQHTALTTRSKYARIAVVYAGEAASDALATNEPSHEPEPVPVIIILEPLYFGVVPKSVVPVLIGILLVASISALAIPKVTRRLEAIAQLSQTKSDKRE